MGWRCILICVVGCASAPEPEPVDPRVIPGSGAAYPIRNPSPELVASSQPFAGSCAFAKPPGELASYNKRVELAIDAAVYSTAERGTDNRIGQLRRGSKPLASGPIASSSESAPGYAVLVADNTGRVCRGYVELTAVAP